MGEVDNDVQHNILLAKIGTLNNFQSIMPESRG